ncbi:bifunctional DNA primase/polymerase [Mycobacteroides abscessus]|uniref:bifunctional DNA primase/polymerase n=1 Tax=Mycobacteroides abscessus TaxID=36809 RepID=UPI000926205B|nr:bifunctional DNA primase/polymerase [Mycobacteroides abscessus]SHX64939.1 gp54 protein [Mycobacteroides abscessus subsp. abscessus]SHZ18016.1 gp54 protein [Mycobacteroides abscessus subsp. abscessus]SIB51123.1 gp54 protein [Mycobacteroides abscessus subsp. abscessus]SIF18399.1 gp54 protein [Mycobacteroides abscessus subsp. abscessus]SKI48234.1 gp54 protein [Mycobacteroides abscessus subsp. abscessus]
MTAVDGLAMALHLSAAFGWAPLPLCPWSKAPAIKGLFDNPPMDKSAIRDAWARAQGRIDRDDAHPEWRGLAPNLGVLLGPSRLLLLDADTPDEVAAWTALCAENGFDPGPPTVRTPGSRGVDGQLKHRDGGHWFFAMPDGLELDRGKLALHVGTGSATAVLYGGRHLAVVPPSVRDTGPYMPAGGSVQPLPWFLAELVREAAERANAPRRESAAAVIGVGTSGGYTASEAEWAWAEQTDWLDLLPGGWMVTGEDRDGHRILARPGASSERSAVVHPDGCTHFPDAKSPAPMTVFTSNPGDWMIPLVADGTPASVSKVRLYALRWYGGDVRQARIALGFAAPSGPTLAPELAPVAVPAPEPVPSAQAPAVGARWAPLDIATAVRDAILAAAWPATPEVAHLVGAAENGKADYDTSRMVREARHITTEQVGQWVPGVALDRLHAVIRALIPALAREHGLTVRERLIDADPTSYGVRAQPADRTAWAVWLPTQQLAPNPPINPNIAPQRSPA